MFILLLIRFNYNTNLTTLCVYDMTNFSVRNTIVLAPFAFDESWSRVTSQHKVNNMKTTNFRALLLAKEE